MLTEEHEGLLRVFYDDFMKTGRDRWIYVDSPFLDFGKGLSPARKNALIEQLIIDNLLEPEGYKAGTTYQYLFLTPLGKNYFEQKKLTEESDARRSAELHRKERKAARRDWVRWIGTSVISLLAIVISILAFLQSTGIIAIEQWPIWK